MVNGHISALCSNTQTNRLTERKKAVRNDAFSVLKEFQFFTGLTIFIPSNGFDRILTCTCRFCNFEVTKLIFLHLMEKKSIFFLPYYVKKNHSTLEVDSFKVHSKTPKKSVNLIFTRSRFFTKKFMTSFMNGPFNLSLLCSRPLKTILQI